MQEVKRLVIKVGSSTLTHNNGKLNLRRIESLARVLSDLTNRGLQVTLVSSGAQAAGVGRLGLSNWPSCMRERQAVAAVGQCELMFLYDKLFSEYGHTVAQVLLTRDVVEDGRRKQNVVNTFDTLLDLGVIPIVNENDTVSVEEIEFGDNDTLSAIVATLVKADLLVLLSDVDGLYDGDPRSHPDAKLIPVVEEIDDQVRALAGCAGTRRGTGGMQTKLCAAEISTGAGIDMIIANGEDPTVLYDIMDGRCAGTRFLAKRA